MTWDALTAETYTFVAGPTMLFVPEESRRTQQIVRKEAGDRTVPLDPAIRSYRVILKAPTTTPQAGDPWAAYTAIQCPVLVVRGATSDILSAGTVERMKELGHDVTAIEVAGVGHAPSLSELEAEAALRTFFSR